MAYCKICGAALPEGTKFCSECGAPVNGAAERPVTFAPQIEFSARPRRKPGKSLLRRWWFWILVLAVIGWASGRGGEKAPEPSRPARGQTTVTAAAPPTARPTEKPVPTAAPTPTPAPEPEAPAAEDEVRPELREFLDAYEACMNEYVDFMQRYMSADPMSMMSMLGDYYSIMERYAEFADRLDALDEEELSGKELAYYLEVTGRVNQRLLSVMGQAG